MESPYFTLKEAAAYARTSTRTIQRRLKAGELNRYGTGHPLVHKEELEALLSATPVDILEEKS
jgi:excisionase family DNA binding protein